MELTADTAGSLRAISDVSDQINTISDQLAAAVQGQEAALAVMEERIAAISGIADRNLQNAGETELSSRFSALYSTETMLPPFTRMVMYSFQPWLNSDIWAV